VDGVGSDGVGHAKHAREDSPDVSPGFGFNCRRKEKILDVNRRGLKAKKDISDDIKKLYEGNKLYLY